MNDVIRTFIALKIKPGPELVKLIATFKQELEREAIKWTDLNNMHLTIKFIGNTSPDQVNQVKAVLADITSQFPVFLLYLNGVGSFQKGGNPNVLFVKIDSSDVLKELAEEIDNQLQPFGFQKESRRFNPHLTLGRIKYLKEKSVFKRLTENFKQYPVQNETCRQITYYQSVLKPQGAVYKSLAEFKLQEGR
ncbi:MAG: RNA 2',3'-cyclic phosphodiesterase [Prolixibacteraceae bacterium]|jgi:2'-5' RNA ligase|nr:RNA 2',3'-cyclic phosphodiesterase [Prolixibacteraceae bacterium]